MGFIINQHKKIFSQACYEFLHIIIMLISLGASFIHMT